MFEKNIHDIDNLVRFYSSPKQIQNQNAFPNFQS